MNLDFHKQYDPAERKTEPEKVSTVYVENAATNTFGWVLKAKARTVSSTLTLNDRRELVKDNLNNDFVNTRAKSIYASGGRIKDIKAGCKIGYDYAKKLHAAFGRAAKKQKQ